MSKYNIPDDHEWSDEKEQEAPEYPKATLSNHTIEVTLHKSDEYQARKKYECHVSHDQNNTKVLYVTPHKDKGNYFRRLDEMLDFHEVPHLVRQRVAKTLGKSIDELTLDERLVNPDDE